MHHIDILGIKNWGFQLKMVRERSQNEKVRKIEKTKKLIMLTRRSTEPGPVDRFVGIWDFKGLPCFIFSPVSSGSLSALLIQLSKSDF